MTDLLQFASIGAMSAYAVTTLESGRIAYVNNVRDFFFLEKTINSGSTDSIQDVVAAAFGGVWHRMGLGGPYWKNQRYWWIDAETGNDENLGASDSPLMTMDELVRRLLGVQKVRYDYVVTLTAVTQSTVNTFGLDVELDGGSVTFVGTPRFSSSLGTITAFNGGVDYTNATAPYLRFAGTGSLDNDLLYASSSVGANAIGWATGGDHGRIDVTMSTLTGAVGRQLYQALTPTLDTPGVVVRGRGDLILNGIRLGTSGNSRVVVGGQAPANVHLVMSSVESDHVEFAGGASIELDRTRVVSRSGSVDFHMGSRTFGSGSGFVTPRSDINIVDSTFEHAGGTFRNSRVVVHDANVVLSIAGLSGSALASASMIVGSNSNVDVRNLLVTQSFTNDVTVDGSACNVFHDDVNRPKATLVVNDGYMDRALLWSATPWYDAVRDVRVASGSLTNVGGV